MPKETGGGGGNEYTRDLVKDWVEKWASFDDKIKELMKYLDSFTGDAAFNNADYVKAKTEVDGLKVERRNIADQIVTAVDSKPKLWEPVVKWGFNESILNDRSSADPPSSGGSAGGPTGSGQDNANPSPGGGGGGGAGNQGGGGGGSGGGGGQGGGGHNLLPGVVGKDFVVKKGSNGKYYVIYRDKVPGTKHSINFMYAISEKDLESGAYGVTKKDVAKGTLTRQEIRAKGNFFNFGNVDEIKRGKGGNRHPFKKFLKLLTEQHPNASWLNSREVMRIMTQAKLEGRGSEWTENMLRQTKWWNKRTEQERAWELTAEGEKSKVVNEQKATIQQMLDQSFGPNVSWGEHVNEDKVGRWAEAIASGRVSAAVIADRISNLAQGIEGTAAWVGDRETGQGLANSLAHYDNAFNFVRQQALEWIGPHAMPDDAYLTNTAKRLAAGKLGQDQLVADLQTKARNLHKWLGEGESWTSRITSYKSAFEGLTGTTIGYDDGVLRNMTAKDAKGNLIADQIMSLDDFDRHIRLTDPRWRQSDRFGEERQGLVNLIQQTFTGVGGGF